MHDGSLATLEDVVRHYEKGGVARPTRSGDLPQHLRLSDSERADLIAFIDTLSSDTPPQPSQEALGRPCAPRCLAGGRQHAADLQVDKSFAPAHVRLKPARR